jgi:hypothetical protein
VPHNLISTQESPVALLKFKMVPRLKIVMSSESKKKKKKKRHVLVKPKLHTHRECGLRFQPLHHTSYTVDCWLAPFSEDVFSSKKVSYNPGLCPIKEQKSGLCSRMGPTK